jgi:hypothetical protein
MVQGLACKVHNLEFRVKSVRVRVYNLGFIHGVWFGVIGLRFGASGLGFRDNE